MRPPQTHTPPPSDLTQDQFVIDQSGAKYFTFGNTRVKVVEYFAKQGKPLSQLLAELVLQEAKKLEENPA